MNDISIIKKWIKEGEGSRLDFKTTISSRPKIAKNLVAFANSRGGKLIVGIEDKGFVVGVDFDGEMYELEKAANEFCVPPIELKFSKLYHQNKTVMIVEVLESRRKPHFALDKNGTKSLYVRLADACVVPVKNIEMMLLNGELNGLQRTHDYELAKRRLLEYLVVNKSVNVVNWANLRQISEENARRFLVDILLEGSVAMQVVGDKMVFYGLV